MSRISAQRHKHHTGIFSTACLVLVLLLAGGCAAPKKYTPPGAHQAEVSTASRTVPTKAAPIIRTARSLIGAPYKWGGTSPSTGFDCSGFVYFVFRQHGIRIPRLSWQQFGWGQTVKYTDIRPGDLIFYQVDKGKKGLHVGIVTDRRTFVHSPSSGKRVMESPLLNSYWHKRFLGARRVL